MTRLIVYLNHEIKVLEEQLKTEENGTKVAIIQGKLAGYNSMISILNEIEITDFRVIKESATIPCVYKKELNKWYCECTDFYIVSELDSIFEKVKEKMERFNDIGKNKIEAKKDWLFFQSEKSRDLHFVKGWFFMFNILNDWKIAVHSQYEYLLKRRKQSLPFEEEEI
jgi:hypothetical protein